MIFKTRAPVIIVNVPNTNIKQSFTIIADNVYGEVHFVEIFRKYVEVRATGSKYDRFF